MAPPIRFWLTVIAILPIGGCLSVPAPDAERQGATTTAAGDPPLKALQAEFRPSYNRARDDVDRTLSPLVVVRFSDVFLVKDGKVVAEAKGIPQKYHMLHRSAHVPLVVFVTLRPHIGQPLIATTVAELTEYRDRVTAAIHDLGNYGFSPDEIRWQEAILTDTRALLESARVDAIISEEEISRYAARIHQPMMSLADTAGAAQVDATHAAMAAWRKALTDEEWARLKVAIVGFRQPRQDYAATQYFAALFPDRSNSLFPGENRRVFYVESLVINREDREFKDERRAVAALILDTSASEVFFNNPYRMSIDVMADGARRRIGELDLNALR